MNRTAHLGWINSADVALTQATAMVHMTFGEAGETFRDMQADLQDSFLWALAERIEAASIAISRLQTAAQED